MTFGATGRWRTCATRPACLWSPAAIIEHRQIRCCVVKLIEVRNIANPRIFQLMNVDDLSVVDDQDS